MHCLMKRECLAECVGMSTLKVSSAWNMVKGTFLHKYIFFTFLCKLVYYTYQISNFNIFRIAYSVFEVDRLISNSDGATNVKIMYDIGCTLSAHLKVQYDYLVNTCMYLINCAFQQLCTCETRQLTFFSL